MVVVCVRLPKWNTGRPRNADTNANVRLNGVGATLAGEVIVADLSVWALLCSFPFPVSRLDEEGTADPGDFSLTDSLLSKKNVRKTVQ